MNISALFSDAHRRLRIYLTKALAVPPKTKSGRKRLIPVSYCAHLILFPAVLLYLEIMLRLLNGTGVFQHLIYPILTALSLGTLMNMLTACFPVRVNHKIGSGLLIVTSLVYVVECLTRNAYQTYMTFSSLLTGAEGVMTGFTDDLLRTIFGSMLPILLLFLPAVLYIIFGLRRLTPHRYRRGFLIPLAVITLAFFGLNCLFGATGGTADMYGSQYDFDTATVVFGLPTSLRLSLVRSESSSSDFDIEEPAPESADGTAAAPDETGAQTTGSNVMAIDLDSIIANSSNETVKNATRYVQSLTPSSKNPYTGLFKGKNLIMICAEAFSDAVIDEKLTPTLYRLTHYGFNFSNYYQPTWGGSTSTGEYSMLTGLIPTNGVDTMQNIIGHNMYFTPANALQREGYFVAGFHNSTYDYYNRHETHPALGFDLWLGQGNGLENIAGRYPDDDDTITHVLDKCLDCQPFCLYFMTMDGHAPYSPDRKFSDYNLDLVKAFTTEEYKETTLCYIAYQYQIEKALSALVLKLEQNGIANDTVICLTADHYPYGLAKSTSWHNDEDFVCDLYKDPDYADNPWTKDHNTLILWSECLENEKRDMWREITDPVYSVDIAPTLANLFGLEFDSRMLVGRDVFSDAEPIVLWKSGSFVTDVGAYNASSGIFTTWDNSPVDQEYVKRIKKIVSNKISFSKAVLNTDYYRAVFGEDTFTSSNIRTVLDKSSANDGL